MPCSESVRVDSDSLCYDIRAEPAAAAIRSLSVGYLEPRVVGRFQVVEGDVECSSLRPAQLIG